MITFNNKSKLRMLELNDREKTILNYASYFRLWSKTASYKFKTLPLLIAFLATNIKCKNANFIIYAVANSLPNQTTPADACIGNFN